MNTNDLNTALYEKMAAEQDKYRDWLKSQPPEEILPEADYKRYSEMIKKNAVTAQQFDRVKTEYEAAKARYGTG